MKKCSFCNNQVEQGKGVTFVSYDKIYNFCSSKCFKNWKLGRDKKRVKWIKKSKK